MGSSCKFFQLQIVEKRENPTPHIGKKILLDRDEWITALMEDSISTKQILKITLPYHFPIFMPGFFELVHLLVSLRRIMRANQACKRLSSNMQASTEKQKKKFCDLSVIIMFSVYLPRCTKSKFLIWKMIFVNLHDNNKNAVHTYVKCVNKKTYFLFTFHSIFSTRKHFYFFLFRLTQV